MKKVLTWSIVCCVVALFGNLLTGCRSCDDRRVDDISKVPGIYEGQAQIIVPENLKRFVPDSLKGALDKPVDAKLRIQENDKGELTLELVDFTMPVKDMKLQPASCEASEDGEAFKLTGAGTVGLPNDKSLSYEYEGSIQEYLLKLEGTVYIVPKLFGVNLVFEGEKC